MNQELSISVSIADVLVVLFAVYVVGVIFAPALVAEVASFLLAKPLGFLERLLKKVFGRADQ